MQLLRASAFGLAAWLATGAPAFAEVQLSIQDGRVTTVAKDATLRQILAEWARVGQTKMVNVERVTGAPMTLQLTNVPEQEALDVLLRSVSGFLAAPRPTAARNLSRFDRIMVMSPSVAPRAGAAPAAAVAPAPAFQTSPFAPPPGMPPAEYEADDQRQTPTVTLPPPRGPVFSTFPAPQIANPDTQGASSTDTPTSPTPTMSFPGGPQPSVPFGGAPRPGMVVPGPAQPGQSPIVPAARPPEGQ